MIDIVIPVYGRYDLLELCLDSIEGACGDYKYRVVVYENATPEMETQEKRDFFSRYDWVKVIYGKQNVGFPVACNTAARKGSNKYLFFLNSDVVLEKDSVARMIARMEENDGIGILGMKLLFPEDIPYPDSGGRPAGKIQHYGVSFNINALPHHIFLGWSAENPRVMRPIEPPAVTGAALMIRRNLWIKIGGFDRDYGMGTYEDVDLCVAARTLGYRVVVFPDTIGTHYTNASALAGGISFPLDINRNIFYNKWQNTNALEWADGSLL